MIRIGRWMSRAEYDAMNVTGRVQPRLSTGKDIAHATLPPDPDAYRAASGGSIFAEFDVDSRQTAAGGSGGWIIVFGPNSICGTISARKGDPLAGMPIAANLVIIATKEKTL